MTVRCCLSYLLRLHSRYTALLGDDPEITLASVRKPSNSQAEKLTRAFTSMMSALYKEEGASLRIEILGEPEVQKICTRERRQL